MKIDKSFVCKNCGSQAKSKFCSNCGQPTKTGRIDFHYLIHEIQHSIFHIDKGILYTFRELTLRPGSTLKGYLWGKRVNHFKPFAFVIILGAIYSFAVHFLDVYPEKDILPTYTSKEAAEFAKYNNEIFDLVYNHYALSMLTLIPIFALSSFLFFKKTGYNYWEHLIIYSYIAGIQITIMLILYLVYYLTRSHWIIGLSAIFSYIYNIWVLIQLFGEGAKFKTGIKSFLSIVVAFTACLFIITIIISILYMIR